VSWTSCELDVILGEFGGADELETRLTSEFLRSNSEEEFRKMIEKIGDQITASRDAGLLQEELNSDIAADDNAMQLEREFRHLTIPRRVRLGYGTRLLEKKQGQEARRVQLGLHESEILEALEHADVRDEDSPEYGHVTLISGLTRRQRAVHMKVKADSLPMLLIEVDADPEAPLLPSVA
jgi:hypothetical protein